jgi:hypothetical protein
MEENKLKKLNNKRRLKLMDYNSTPSNSWKKKLKLYELNIIDGQIKIERLKLQYQ